MDDPVTTDVVKRLKLRGSLNSALEVDCLREIEFLNRKRVALLAEGSGWKNAARVMAALYGRNTKWDGGSWFRDNIEMSLDEDLPPEDIEELLQIAWKANKDGVTAALESASGSQCAHEPYRPLYNDRS